jgi:hypothetical protein
MVVKNIVNIQNNKLDFDINGTNNSLKYSFRGLEHFRLTEVGGTSHVQFIAQNASNTTLFTDQSTGTNVDFVGRISNINNHVINNLKDVDATNPVEGDVLLYDGTNWINKPPIVTLTIAADADTTSLIDLRTETFKIAGTGHEIETTLDIPSTSIIIGLPTSVIVAGELRVGPSSRSRALITTTANNDVIFRNNDATANSGIVLGSNGEVTIDSESNIKLTIGTSSRLEVDSTNSVFATDLYIVNKDSEGSLIHNRGGHFHSEGTNFYIAYNNGTNVTNFTTDYAMKLALNNNTFINAPSGGNVELSINADTKFLVGGGGDVFIKNELNIGELDGGANASVNFSVSGSGTSRQILFSDVHGTNNFIDLTDTRFRINHISKVSARINGQNKLVITSNEIKVDNNANLLVTGLAKVNGNLIVDGTAGIQGALAINGGLTLNGCNLEVGGNTTIDGNLTVNGTTIILNTEIKLIEDPMIELGYVGTDVLTDPQDIGFFGQYKADNYAGLYYEVSSTAFRVFDSLGTNDYLTSLATNPNGNVVTTNSRTANIEAKNFITKNGDFGQDIPISLVNLDNNGGTVSTATNFLTQLESVYGTNSGLYCGKSIFILYKTDFTASSSILLNYNFHSAGTNKIVKTAVELETRGGDINFIGFDSDTNDITADITGNPSGFYKFSIRLLPLLTKTVPI